jgi:hypothetical protein
MKYIMFDRDGLPTPVLFPATMQHAEVAKCFGAPPLSAGFITVRNDKVEVFGSSDSLELAALEKDARTIQLYLHQDDGLQKLAESPKRE